jgi:hypothetical protein
VIDPASPALRVVEARLAAADATATLREYAPDQDLAARDWLVHSWQEMLRTGRVQRFGYAPANRLVAVYGLSTATILAALLAVVSIAVKIARTFRMTLHQRTILQGDLRRCPCCGYDVSACASAICPECGCDTAARTQHSLQALETAAPIGSGVTEVGALRPAPPGTPAQDAGRQ